MKHFYLSLLLTPLLLALPANGYAQVEHEPSAISSTAEANSDSSIKFDPPVLYCDLGAGYGEYDGTYKPYTEGSEFILESSNPEIAGWSYTDDLIVINGIEKDGNARLIFYYPAYNRGTCTLTITFPNGASGQLTVRVLGPEEFEYSNVSIDGVYYNFDRETQTAEVVKVPDGAEPYKGKITIPSQLEWYGKKYAVTSVGEHAFASRDVTSVQLPTSLKEIKPYAFMQSNLTYVDILDAVESIGESAFKDCTSLESVYLGAGDKEIGHDAFTGCTKLTQFFISDSSYTFTGSDGVIYDKNFTKLILVPYGKESISIPATVISIGEGSFMGNKLIDNISFPENLETIEDYACAGCASLKQAVIPDRVTSVGDFAFSDCTNMSRISLGRQLGFIGENAFGQCGNISEIYVYRVLPPMISASTFANYNARLYVPKGRRGSYANADIWQNFSSIEEFDTSADIKNIEANARGILVRNDGDFITISGLNENECVSVYSIEGIHKGRYKAIAGTVVLNVNRADKFLVLKIGEESIKVAL